MAISPEGPLAVWQLPPAPAFVAARWIDRLGEELATRPEGRGLLVEWRDASATPLVGTAEPAAVLGLRTVLGERANELAVARGPPTPPRGGHRLGLFHPSPGEATAPDGASGRPPRPAAPGPARPPRPGGRWAVQWHLFANGRPGRLAGSLRLGVADRTPAAGQIEAELVAHLASRLETAGQPARYEARADRWPNGRAWATGRLGRFRSDPLFELPAGRLSALGPGPPRRPFPGPEGPTEHAVLLGASGSGKTSLLATLGARALRHGRSVVAVDLHGDLAPALVADLSPERGRRVVALDLPSAVPGGPGLDVVGAGGEREAALLVAALRRGSDDRGEVYWGFRLDRLFDAFVRLTLEERGDLRDLFALLTDARRREAARLATASPTLARFLEEVEAACRRQPEYLAPAAARLAKLAQSEPLLRLLAPRGPSVPFGELLEGGGSLLVRLPVGEVGPEAAALAATLILARVYLERTARPPGTGRPVLLLLDEAQALAPTLLAEILAEGRKFGLTAVLATQYPGRFAEGLREAAAGSVGAHLLLRTPRAGAEAVARWAGLSREEAERWLPGLPPGSGVACLADEEGPRFWSPPEAPPRPDLARWGEVVAATRETFGVDPNAPATDPGEDEVGELLLAARGLELVGELPGATRLGSGPGGEAALERAVRRGWLAVAGAGDLRVTEAGRVYLGERRETGAVSESAEHRRLLVEAFRLFARHGERIEILRQGRFDTRLPDARLRLLPPAGPRETPEELGRRLAARRATWAWRAFGGRDVHLEAEVSGAERRERLLRDLEKAEAAAAHCLFLVSDAARAAKVRAVLRRAGRPPRTATVWVLRPAASGDPAPRTSLKAKGPGA